MELTENTTYTESSSPFKGRSWYDWLFAAVLLVGEGEPSGEPVEPDVHCLSRPVAPNRLRAMVGSKLAPRPAGVLSSAAGTVQSRTPTRSCLRGS